MAIQITANLPTLAFPKEVDYPTQEDWAAFSAAAELNFGILGSGWSTQMQLWKTQANAMSTELNNNADIAQAVANYQGNWTSQGYTLGQTVSVGGIYYICKLTHATGQNPTTGGSIYWNLAIGNWNLKVDTNMSGYTSKTTPADADLIPLSDSTSTFGIKKLTWANLKTNLATYLSTGTGFAISLTANGYIKFPSWLGGLIIQWGTSSNTGYQTYQTFPLVFPNAIYSLTATAAMSSDLSVALNNYIIGKGTITTTSFYWNGVDHNGSIQSTAGNLQIKYIAIGY